jgi:hypothetical protein
MINWTQESVSKVAEELRFLPNIWSEDTLASARKVLSVISELPEVRGLVEALQYYDDYEQFKGQSFVASNALAPFTSKGE